MMWALLIMIVTATGPTSATIYFADKDQCEKLATFMSNDMHSEVNGTVHWIEHAYIHCMPLREGE